MFGEGLVDDPDDGLAGLQVVDSDENGDHLEAVRGHFSIAHPRLVVDALDVAVGRV